MTSPFFSAVAPESMVSRGTRRIEITQADLRSRVLVVSLEVAGLCVGRRDRLAQYGYDFLPVVLAAGELADEAEAVGSEGSRAVADLLLPDELPALRVVLDQVLQRLDGLRIGKDPESHRR